MSKLVALTRPQPEQPCCCGSTKTFASCCGSLLSGERKPGSAEELMRSRFSAHVVRDDLYLHRTFLPTAKKPFKPEDGASSLSWTRLVVHSHETGPAADQAFVEFSAYYFDEDSPEMVIQERSEFKKVDDQWYYSRHVRSGPPPVRVAVKAGRNDSCPCGSGKKFKHCCGSK